MSEVPTQYPKEKSILISEDGGNLIEQALLSVPVYYL